jgi:hypothetical protein
MRIWSLVVFALIGVALEARVQPAPEAPSQGPPERIESSAADRSQPVWVAAGLAIRQGGLPAQDLFTPFELSQLQRMAEVYREQREAGRLGNSSDPCAGARGIEADYYVPEPAIEQLVEYSEVIFSGTVRGGGEGLYKSQPVRLYRVSVDEVWKGEEVLRPGETAFVAFPQAEIRMGDDWLCTRSPRFPDQPKPGKQILVFSHGGPDGGEPIFYPMDVELIFETQTSISVPGHLSAKLSSSRFADLEAMVSEASHARRESP